jgi:S-adenosylmethionine-diacylglycerol 3-amino-3-carboxypropyl transferase
MSGAGTEAAGRADFTRIRYAQVWEDADVLLDGLAVSPGDTVVSIASAGDNALALLGAGAARVVALDLNPAQLSCLALRVAAYRSLDHAGLLELVGSRPSDRRAALYARCREALGSAERAFWDARPEAIATGIGDSGKFEAYFRLFRRRVLPLVHGRTTIDALLRGGADRERFYRERWNTWRWRLLFRVFFSRFVMGRLGRDPAFFQYVEGSVADRILARTRHALTVLDPAENPYLHWILRGVHGTALPWALRAENFERIRSRLDRLEWHPLALETFLEREAARGTARTVVKCNLSDIFEYMSDANTQNLLARLAEASLPGGRLAYWNMLAPRRRGPALAGRLRPLEAEAAAGFAADKAFFYSAFVVEEVV